MRRAGDDGCRMATSSSVMQAAAGSHTIGWLKSTTRLSCSLIALEPPRIPSHGNLIFPSSTPHIQLVVLEPISKNLALLAAFWRLAECSLLALITWNDLVALRLLNGANYLRA